MSLHRLEEIFGEGGTLSKELSPDYEPRPQQAEMAYAVHRTLSDGGVLLVEAPTGVGKSLAYLVPAVLWAHREKRPVVVATHTRSLQDQILDHDLPHLRRLIERRIRAVALKGRANYLCRERWDHLLEEARGTVEGEDLERALGSWVQTTETGELSEAPLPEGRPGQRVAALLPRISSDARFCANPRCTPENGCFFKRSRLRAREADLIIVNHALLLIDLLTGAAGLPDWSAVVIDEAHQFPRAAADPLSLSLSEKGLDAALQGLGGRGEPGCTDELRRALRNHPSKADRAEQLAALRELEADTARVEARARSFWTELKLSPAFPRGDRRQRYGPGSERRDLFPPSGLELCESLRAHLQALEGRAERIRRQVEQAAQLTGGEVETERAALAEAARWLDEARGVEASLCELLLPTRPDSVYWIEPESAAGAALRAAPLDVGPALREALFRPKEAVICTSATLSIEGRFEHFARKLGLDADQAEGVALATPFRLDEQVAGRVLEGGPDPNDPAFAAYLARGVDLLAQTLRRKMLVLFTAHETLRRVEGLLRTPLEERGIRLFAQGVDGGRRRIGSSFRAQGPAVLLGAASFWEGVDFPGEELEVLVMARLPFLVPTDPVVEATAERLQEAGHDPFRDFHLPEAIIRFRQGFGRLIRRRTDRGLFVVVDPRMVTRGYGRRFATSTGAPFRPVATWEELATEAAAWFDRSPLRDTAPPEAPPGS